MKILFASWKGSQGKTSLAVNIALEKDYGVITNDFYSPIDLVLNEKQYIVLKPNQSIPEIPKDTDVVFDFANFLDKRIIEVIKTVDMICIPVLNNYIEIKICIDTIRDVMKYNSNILIIANKANEADYKNIKSIINELFPDIEILPLKNSSAFPRIFTDKKCIKQMVKDKASYSYHFKPVQRQLDKIYKYIGV